MTILCALQHLGYTILPRADFGWISEAGPGPSYGDDQEDGAVGCDSEFTQHVATIMTLNLMYKARILKDASGLPKHGNDRNAWKAGYRFDCEIPKHCV